jgi:hypothetical protein
MAVEIMEGNNHVAETRLLVLDLGLEKVFPRCVPTVRATTDGLGVADVVLLMQGVMLCLWIMMSFWHVLLTISCCRM